MDLEKLITANKALEKKNKELEIQIEMYKKNFLYINDILIDTPTKSNEKIIYDKFYKEDLLKILSAIDPDHKFLSFSVEDITNIWHKIMSEFPKNIDLNNLKTLQEELKEIINKNRNSWSLLEKQKLQGLIIVFSCIYSILEEN